MNETTATNEGAPAGAQIQLVDHGLMHASPTNPRTRFDEAPLEELSRNIEEHGVRIPLLARPSRLHEGGFEIVAGERRFRANGLALKRLADGLAENEDEPERRARWDRLVQLPVIVQDLDDATVLELQLIENLQRQDLTPLEEARGYQRLLDLPHGDYTPAKIAQKIGKSLDVVLRKLRMLRAPEMLLEALEAGQVSERVLVMVATVPGERQRVDCAKKVLKGQYDFQADKQVALSVRDTLQLINTEFRVTLKGCPWDLEDAALLPDAGACAACPHFAQKAAEMDATLADELGNGRGMTDPLTCMNPACFRSKMDAHWKRARANAEESKLKVLTPAETKRVFADNGRVLPQAGLVKLDEAVPAEIVGHYDARKTPTWRQVLEGVDIADGLSLARDPKGRVVELIDRRVAVEAAKAHPKHGRMFEGVRASGKRALTDEEKAQREREAFDVRVKKRAQLVLLTHLSEQALARGMDVEASRVILDLALREAGMDGCRLMAEWLRLEVTAPQGMTLMQTHYRTAILEHVAARDGGKPEAEVMVMIALLSRWVKNSGLDVDLLEPVEKFFGFDDKTILAMAKAEVQAEMSTRAAKAKPVSKSTGRDKDAARETELANAQVAIDGILRQGDEERGLADSGLPGAEWMETVLRPLQKGDGAYHCDSCGIVCRVPHGEIERVESMQTGEFLCLDCETDKEGWVPLPEAEQEHYVRFGPTEDAAPLTEAAA